MNTRANRALNLKVLERALGEKGLEDLLNKYEANKITRKGGFLGTRTEPSSDMVRIAEYVRDNRVSPRAAATKFGTTYQTVESAIRRVSIYRFLNNKG